MDISNKVAIVTGGIRGIGLSIVQHLLKNGVKFVAILNIHEPDNELVIRNLEQLKQEFSNDKFGYYQCDVTNSNEFNTCYEKVSQLHGYVDILVNNAATANERNIDLIIDTNYKAVIKCNLTAIEHMKKEKSQKGGVIVNIGSFLGLINAPLAPVYATTKHAVVSFVQSMKESCNFCIEHNENLGVRILCVCPGLTKTDMVDLNNLRECTLNFVDVKDLEPYATMYTQAPDNVAAAVVEIIQRGENGAVWLAQNDEPAWPIKEFVSVEELRVPY